MEDVEARLRALQEEQSNLKALIDNLGWKRLMEIADGQLKNRMPSILEKTENFLELPGKEYEKGEMAGINLFTRLPGIAIEGLEQDIKQLEGQIDATGRDRSTDDGSTDGGDDTFDGDAPRV